MVERTMNRFKILFRKPELHAFIACLILMLFGWPILTILETTRKGFIFFYLFVCWGLVIVILFLIAISHQELEQGIESEPEE